MGKKRNHRNIKKYSYRERHDYHADRVHKAVLHDGVLNKRDSYSVGYTCWDKSPSLINDLSQSCDKEAFEAGVKAGYDAYNKAIDHKF